MPPPAEQFSSRQALAGRLESLTLSPPGEMGLGSQPPRHKDKLPNRSTTAYWHGKAVVRGMTRVRPALLDVAQVVLVVLPRGLVRPPTAEGVPRAGGGAPGLRECFPAHA